MAAHEEVAQTDTTRQNALPGLEALGSAPTTPPEPRITAASIMESIRAARENPPTTPPMPETDNKQPDRDDPRWENRVENSGFTPAAADVAATGVRPKGSSTASFYPRAPKSTKKPRGSSYPQDESRADVPPPPKMATPRTAAEEAALQGSAHRAVVADAVAASSSAAKKSARGDVRTQLALEVARADRRAGEDAKWRARRGLAPSDSEKS